MKTKRLMVQVNEEEADAILRFLHSKDYTPQHLKKRDDVLCRVVKAWLVTEWTPTMDEVDRLARAR